MPKPDDYLMTIEEVAKRLNKSIRTVHRYKDSGRLSYHTGSTQGNPLYFSRSEVEGLAKELYPHLTAMGEAQDHAMAERLDRVERLLAQLDQNPALMRLLQLSESSDGKASPEEVEEALRDILALQKDGQPVDRHELGDVLVRLGNKFLKS